MRSLFREFYWWWHDVIENRSVARAITLAGLLLLGVGLILRDLFSLHPELVYVPWAEKGCAIVGVLLTAFAGLTTLVIVVWDYCCHPNRIWNPHPAGKVTSNGLLYLPPEPDWNNPYRFHKVTAQDELEPYVVQSDRLLGGLNSDLSFVERRNLYECWFSLNEDTFLYLTKSGRKQPVALSIVLPLTKTGYERLLGINGCKKTKVIEFGSQEIMGRGGHCHSLLIDTYIVASRQVPNAVDEASRIGSITQKISGLFSHDSAQPKKRYGHTLILKHVSLYWKDFRNQGSVTKSITGKPNPRPIAILAETNKPTMVAIVSKIGFKMVGTSAIDAPLYKFEYPLEEDTPKKRLELVQGVIQNVWTLKKWKMVRSR